MFGAHWPAEFMLKVSDISADSRPTFGCQYRGLLCLLSHMPMYLHRPAEFMLKVSDISADSRPTFGCQYRGLLSLLSHMPMLCCLIG